MVKEGVGTGVGEKKLQGTFNSRVIKQTLCSLMEFICFFLLSSSILLKPRIQGILMFPVEDCLLCPRPI
jgi:hypothetical protein